MVILLEIRSKTYKPGLRHFIPRHCISLTLKLLSSPYSRPARQSFLSLGLSITSPYPHSARQYSASLAFGSLVLREEYDYETKVWIKCRGINVQLPNEMIWEITVDWWNMWKPVNRCTMYIVQFEQLFKY